MGFNKSYHFLHLALEELEKISSKYPTLPKFETLNEEQISWLNERMRLFSENVNATKNSNFSFLHQCKEVRNIIAHSTSSISKNKQTDTWQKFFNFLPTAKAEIEQIINSSSSERKKKRKFEKFGSSDFGNELERKKLTQAIADEMDTSLKEEEKLPFQENQSSQEAEKFLQPENQDQKELLDFAKNHSELNQQIQEEIVETLQSAYDETELTNPENPFYEENLLINSINNVDDEDLLKNLSKWEQKISETPTGKENSTDINFYKKQFRELSVSNEENQKKKSKKDNKYFNNQIEILSRNLKSDLQKSLQERYISWQLEEIDKRRKAYLEELYKKIEQFKKLEERLSSFIKNFGRLWDLSNIDFQDYGFEILKTYADLLENDDSLKELADMMGRQATETERFEKELREKTVIKTEYHPKPAYRGQINGLRLSGEISSCLPSELAMSKNPTTKLYFAQKFAERKLQSYSYINQQKTYRQEKTTEEVEVSIKEKEPKGPVIICVDTSGSMNGTPERVAKTITFALAKKCLEDDRKCFLISFSTGIEVQDLSTVEKGNGLTSLVNFLRKSFNGGTDATPALDESLRQLKTEKYKNADVLMISDFIMDTLPPNTIESIKKEQKKGTYFYSLVIGNSANNQAIGCFNESLDYNPNDTNSRRRFCEKIHNITQKRHDKEEKVEDAVVVS